MGSKNSWADWAHFFGGRHLRHNQAVQVWWQSVQGFLVGWGSNFAFSDRLWRSSLQHSHYRVRCDMAVWSFSVKALPTVGRRSVLNITLISYTPLLTQQQQLLTTTTINNSLCYHWPANCGQCQRLRYYN